MEAVPAEADVAAADLVVLTGDIVAGPRPVGVGSRLDRWSEVSAAASTVFAPRDGR